ncbi:MAG: heme o synthase [Acidimicrobiia bacterium]
MRPAPFQAPPPSENRGTDQARRDRFAGHRGPEAATAPTSRRLRVIAVSTLVATYILVTLGGLVRATGSGLGCPDWPRCHGRLIPPPDIHAWIEWSHRLAASVVIILTMVLASVGLWTTRRRGTGNRRIRVLSVVPLPLVFSQALLGALVVALHLQSESVVAHLLVAMAIVGVLVALVAETRLGSPQPSPARALRFSRSATGVALGALGVMLLGSYVSGRGAGLAYSTWPLFDGSLLPTSRGMPADLHSLHRVLAAVVGIAALVLARDARRGRQPQVVARMAIAGAGLYWLQVMVGASNVWTRLHSSSRTVHLALGAAVWGTLFATSRLARRVPANEFAPRRPKPETSAATTGGPRRGSSRVLAYVALTKPRIVELLLVTTVPAMILAEGGMPALSLIGAVLLGGSLAAGGANAINCFVDRDIDAAMHRTSGRPLPKGSVDPSPALVFGVTLEVLAFLLLWTTVNLLSAALALSAGLFYVFVYSMWLKRSTPENIVIGGAAGAVPVLVGWAAVTGGVGLAAWVMFAIVFVWTPPHFWALALRYREDYARAGVPMLPVVAGVPATARRIVAYSYVLVAVTLALYPIGRTGLVYLLTAACLGVLFVRHALHLRRQPTTASAVRLFSYSVTYLSLLFLAIAADTLLPVGRWPW